MGEKMKAGKAYTLAYRRKREGKTDYRARLKFLASGKNRVVLRRTLNNFYVQIVEYFPEGDKVLVSASTRGLLKFGWKGHRGNLSSSYLTGLLCGLKAKKMNIKSGIVDLGFFRVVRGSSLFAAVKGLKDSGFDISASEKMFPSVERIEGKHIEEYAASIKNKEEYKKLFSSYIKSGLSPEKFSKHFQDVKEKLISNDGK
jgi:large subunit ribosomal protein L18